MTRRSIFLLTLLAAFPAAFARDQPAKSAIPFDEKEFARLFDEAADRTRVVALLSPTCGVCLDGAGMIASMLKDNTGLPIRAWIVWEPILITDRPGPKPSALARITDARAVHLWDREHRLSALLGGPSRFAQRAGDKVHFKMGEFIWDAVLVYPPGVKWESGRAAPRFAGGQVVNVIEEAGRALR